MAVELLPEQTPFLEYVYLLYLILGIVWVGVFIVWVIKEMKTMEPIALGIIALPSGIVIIAISGQQQFGWELWVGGSIIAIPFALMGLMYLILILLKKRKLRSHRDALKD